MNSDEIDFVLRMMSWPNPHTGENRLDIAIRETLDADAGLTREESLARKIREVHS